MATLSMVDGGEHVVFKVDEPALAEADDGLRMSTFKMKRMVYRIVVFEESAERGSEPFTLSISVKP